MNVIIQIICMLVSFIYGILINLLIIFNQKIFKSNNLFINIFFKMLYSFIIVLLYVILIYKINKGVFHIYFLLLMLIGYLLSRKIKCKIKM